MKNEYLGSCEKLSVRLCIEMKCCDACHEEDEREYCFLGQVEFEDGYYDACCKMKNCCESSQ